MLDLVGFNEYANINEPDKTMLDRLRFDDALEIPWVMTDVELWANYTDERLYELDKLIRNYLSKSRYRREKHDGMKTALPLVFLAIFGRKAEPSDSQTCVVMHRLLEYYCKRYTGASKIGNLRVSRVYYFSKYSFNSKRPLSLRLRLETRNDKYALQEYRTNEPKGPKPRHEV